MRELNTCSICWRALCVPFGPVTHFAWVRAVIHVVIQKHCVVSFRLESRRILLSPVCHASGTTAWTATFGFVITCRAVMLESFVTILGSFEFFDRYFLTVCVNGLIVPKVSPPFLVSLRVVQPHCATPTAEIGVGGCFYVIWIHYVPQVWSNVHQRAEQVLIWPGAVTTRHR